MCSMHHRGRSRLARDCHGISPSVELSSFDDREMAIFLIAATVKGCRATWGAKWERRCLSRPGQTLSEAATVANNRALTCANALEQPVLCLASSVRIEGVRGSNPLSSTQVRGQLRSCNWPFCWPVQLFSHPPRTPSNGTHVPPAAR